MNLPIPLGGTEPLKVGDRVQIVPEWQDPGDSQFERFVIEAPPGTTQVRIRTIIPGFMFHPTEWIEADHLICISITETNKLTSHENHHPGQRPPHQNRAALNLKRRRPHHLLRRRRDPAFAGWCASRLGVRPAHRA